VIQLYAITDNPSPPLPDVAPFRLVSSRDLSAVYASAHPVEVTAETLWEHERVIEALMHDRDLLPVRYGTCMPDERAAAMALESNHDRLSRALAFVRGAVEVSVRVLAGDPERADAVASASTGTAYLRARAGQLAARDEASRAIHEPLSACARAQKTRSTSLPGEFLHAAYLVNHHEVETFSSVVEGLQTAHGSWRLTCTGPWPPYSFVEQ
jgi:hypothetical protein